MVKQTQFKEKKKVKQTQQITYGSKSTNSPKKKKKKQQTNKPKPNILKSETNGQCNQTLIDVERKKET